MLIVSVALNIDLESKSLQYTGFNLQLGTMELIILTNFRLLGLFEYCHYCIRVD